MILLCYAFILQQKAERKKKSFVIFYQIVISVLTSL